jgi:hypothetical protein
MKRFGFYPTAGEGVYLNHRLIALVVLVRDQSDHDREIVVYLSGVDRPVTLTNGSATDLLELIDPPRE